MRARRRPRLCRHSLVPNQTSRGRPSPPQDGLAPGRPSVRIPRREGRTGGWGRQTPLLQQGQASLRRPRPPQPRRRQRRLRRRRRRGVEKSRRVATAATMRTAVAAAVASTVEMVTPEVATLGAAGLPTALPPARRAVYLVALVVRTQAARTSRSRLRPCAGADRATQTGPPRPQGRRARWNLPPLPAARPLPLLRRSLPKRL